MKRIVNLGLLVLALAALGRMATAHEDEHKTTKVTLTGAPIDLTCYADGHSKVGDKPDCAESCIAKKGLGAGFVVKEGGKNVIYIVTGSDNKKIYGVIGPHINKMTKVTGEVTEVDNLKLLSIEKIEPLPANGERKAIPKH